MNASSQDKLIQLHVWECYCLSLLTYCYGALYTGTIYAKRFFFSFFWVGIYLSVYFINGIGKLDFLHLSKLVTAQFFKHLYFK